MRRRWTRSVVSVMLSFTLISRFFHAGLHQFGDFAFAGRQLFKRIFLNDRHKRLFQRPPRRRDHQVPQRTPDQVHEDKPRMAPMVSKCMNSACELR